MHTSVQSFTRHTAKAAAAEAERRASIAREDAEKQERFQDLLSERKARETPAWADHAAANAQERATVLRRPAAEPAATATPADGATLPPQPMQAISVQQAMLTAPATAKPDAKETVTGDPGGPVAEDGAGSEKGDVAVKAASSKNTLPLIDPHDPPVILEDDEGSMPTGGIKSPHIDPHGPPIIDDGDPAPGGGVKLPAIKPHGPPVATDGPRSTIGIRDEPSVPSPNPAAPIGSPDDRATASTTAAPQGLPGATISAPASQPNPPGLTAPVNGSARIGYTTTIPAQISTPPEAVPANGAAATAFSITTAAQAQLAANLAAEAPGNPADAEPADFLTSEAANLASRVGQTSVRGAGRISKDLSQIYEQEDVKLDPTSGGTSAAKGLANVMTYPSNAETATEHAAWFKPGSDVFAGSDSPDGRNSNNLTGRAKDGDAARASVATAFEPHLPAATAQTPFAAAASAAPSTGIVQVDKMETLLQTVQQTAAQVQFEGTGQMELRVRLEGVAEGVTVRVHLDENKQTQVSFQTGSPELRAALEQGWSDLKASTFTPAESSSTSLPDSPAARPAASLDPSDSYRDGRRVSSATVSTVSEQASRRWSGYA